jgi:hypothetical protein
VVSGCVYNADGTGYSTKEGATEATRVHRRANERWDYDMFYLSGAITTYSAEAGDNFRTKAAALAEANEQLSRLCPIAV